MSDDDFIEFAPGVFPVFFADLAQQVGASESAVRRSLRRLCEHGVFTRVSKGLPGFPPLYRANVDWPDNTQRLAA